MHRPIIMIALAMSCTSALSAESRPPLPAGMAACAEIPDAVQRATCYDKEVARLRGQGSSPSASPSPARPAGSAPAATADFGSEALASRSHPADQPATLEARISALQELQQGVYVITLDNGQVWRQPERRAAFELKIGDKVTISKATMGAYRLWLDSRGSKQWVRVVRVR
jgi:hypothetical protein